MMKNLKFTFLSALVLIALTASLGAAPIPITAPQKITVPGNYLLANDITGFIEIQASDVTLNLGGHTINGGSGIVIDPFDSGGLPLVNARVSNGQIAAGSPGGIGVEIGGSSCLITGLKIAVGQVGFIGAGEGFLLLRGAQFNRIHGCVITGPQSGSGRVVFDLFLASHNSIQNNTLAGSFEQTIAEQDQSTVFGAVAGDNTFSGNQFASPTP
jgi:hypothetical protein